MGGSGGTTGAAGISVGALWSIVASIWKVLRTCKRQSLVKESQDFGTSKLTVTDIFSTSSDCPGLTLSNIPFAACSLTDSTPVSPFSTHIFFRSFLIPFHPPTSPRSSSLNMAERML
ncbi:hypothetical protein D3C81_1412890 [compost metagenome]